MFEPIEKLLILQDRDRIIRRLQGELTRIEPERQTFKAKLADTQARLESAKQRVKHLESDRKRLELEVEAKKELIERYSNQQLQTRKNEEYRALSHEIEMCKADITKIEDEEIESLRAPNHLPVYVGRTCHDELEHHEVGEENVRWRVR